VAKSLIGDACDDEKDVDIRIQEAIGRSLHSHYEDLLRAPVPDRFLVLLAELEAKERKNG
jgi:hypothetical protein